MKLIYIRLICFILQIYTCTHHTNGCDMPRCQYKILAKTSEFQNTKNFKQKQNGSYIHGISVAYVLRRSCCTWLSLRPVVHVYERSDKRWRRQIYLIILQSRVLLVYFKKGGFKWSAIDRNIWCVKWGSVTRIRMSRRMMT